MANFIQKDNKKRQVVLKDEIKRLEYKAIIKNLNLPKQVRYEYVLKLNNLKLFIFLNLKLMIQKLNICHIKIF